VSQETVQRTIADLSLDKAILQDVLRIGVWLPAGSAG
jgi:hypothetical protein